MSIFPLIVPPKTKRRKALLLPVMMSRTVEGTFKAKKSLDLNEKVVAGGYKTEVGPPYGEISDRTVRKKNLQ